LGTEPFAEGFWVDFPFAQALRGNGEEGIAQVGVASSECVDDLRGQNCPVSADPDR